MIEFTASDPALVRFMSTAGEANQPRLKWGAGGALLEVRALPAGKIHHDKETAHVSTMP